jgi:hypothetical protein
MPDRPQAEARLAGATEARTGGQRLVVNISWYKGRLPADVRYVGRGTPYGNRFVMGLHGDRDQVCDMHERDLMVRLRDRRFADQMVKDLDGMHLGCHCKRRTGPPVRCHADTLLREVARRTTNPGMYRAQLTRSCDDGQD